VSFSPDLSDPDAIRSNPSAGAINGPFLFSEIEPAGSDTKNTDRVAWANLSLPFALGGDGAGRLKLGLEFRDKDKTQDVLEQAFELADDNDMIRLGQDIGEPSGSSVSYPATYPLPPFTTSPNDVASFVNRFGSQLDGETSLEAESQDYDLNERVLAGYVMTELNLSPSFLLLPGLRYEHTRVESLGHAFDSEDENADGSKRRAQLWQPFPDGPRTLRAGSTHKPARRIHHYHRTAELHRPRALPGSRHERAVSRVPGRCRTAHPDGVLPALGTAGRAVYVVSKLPVNRQQPIRIRIRIRI
jgi:hypothetical protein